MGKISIKESTLLCLDTETTGPNPDEDKIVEIGGAYRFAPGKGGSKTLFRSLVNPGIPIPDGARDVHGISDEDVADAAPWGTVSERLALHVEGGGAWLDKPPIIVGYNIIDFDAVIINAENERIGKADAFERFKCIDPVVWIRWHQRQGYPAGKKFSRRLEPVCAHFGIDLKNAHTAAADALATLRLTELLLANGSIPDDLGKVMVTQVVLMDALANERSAFSWYLYADREKYKPEDVILMGNKGDLHNLPLEDLRIGFGKHSGDRLLSQRRYIGFMLKNFSAAMPDYIKRVFKEVSM